MLSHVALGPKQNRFVAEYLKDPNGKQAAIRAGYSPHSAEQQASALLRNPKVAALIDEALARRAARVELEADDVIREVYRLAMVDIGQAFDGNGSLKPLKDMPTEVRRAISGIDVQETTIDGQVVGRLRKVRLWDKKGALELLARHMGLLKDKLELSGTLTLEQLVAAGRERV